MAPSTPVGVPEGEAVGTSQASEYADPKAKPTEVHPGVAAWCVFFGMHQRSNHEATGDGKSN